MSQLLREKRVERMHVVFLTHDYPPFTFGGVGTFVENLARPLSEAGIRTTVLCGYPMQFKPSYRQASAERNEAVDIIRFPYPNLPPRHLFFQLLNFSKLRDTIRKMQADVVHGQGGSTFPAILALRTLAPAVVTFHDSPKSEETLALRSLTRGGSLSDFLTYALGYPLWSSTFRMELRLSKVAVAVSKALRSDLLTEMGKQYSEKLYTIHNGVDTDRLIARYQQFGSTIEERGDTILFAGRLFWRKGIYDLVRIAESLQRKRPNLKLLVHGTGPLLRTITDDIERLGLRNMEIKGFTSPRTLIENMKRSSFILLPSAYEAYPMIILEAMCLGKIPVMYDLPFAREITDNGRYGILATDADDVVKKIGSVIDTGRVESLQKRIREYSLENYNAKKMVHDYLTVYEKASTSFSGTLTAEEK